MKHFAFLILAIALFVNITWAAPNENGLLARFKRARSATPKAIETALATPTYDVSQNTLSTQMKDYAIGQVLEFSKGKNFAKLDDPDSGRLSTTIQSALKTKFGGNWFVMGCEADEYCSLTHIGKHLLLKVTNGQSVWFYIAKY